MQHENWESMWKRNSIGFHKAQVHPSLLKHEKHFAPNSRIYVPLCGKSVDLVHLANKGFDVHGSEFVEKGVKDFFADQGLEYTVQKDATTGIPVYTAVSKKITIYQGDFFKLNFNIIGKFDAMWDRGSLVAINPSDRDKYATIMLELMAPNCRYLLNSFLITGDLYQGPPHSVPTQDIDSMFGKTCDMKLLESQPAPIKLTHAKEFEVFDWLLTLKP